MRLSFRNADWKRVLRFYLFYAVLVCIMAWPFCIPYGGCSTPFEWLWIPYLAGSSTPRFVLIVGFEFYLSLMVALCVRFKEEQVDEEPDHENREFLNKIGVIIPCHKSAQVIGATLELALHHFPAQNIVVMDNGRSKLPLDNCLQEVRKVSSEVIYRWVPVGHKAVALMLGSRLLPKEVEYLLLIDDDVLIPRGMRFDSSYFDNENVSAVAYSIAGCGADNTPESMNYVQEFQDFEFKLADTYRVFVSQYTTIMFAHGAVGLWRRNRFTEIYSIHPGLPIGEDGWAGRLNLLAGYEMKHDSGPLIRTEVPPDLVPKEWWIWMCNMWCCCFRNKDEDGNGEAAVVAGYGSPDLFNQRARRWEMNSPRRICCHTKLFFTYGWDQFGQLSFFRAVIFNLLFRLNILRGAWTLFGALIYISYLARVIYSSDILWVIALLVVLYALQVFKYVLVNYCVWRHRRDLRVSVRTMCLMPFYRKLMVLYRCYGYFRSVLKYVPIVKVPDKVLGERDDLIEIWPEVRDQNEAVLFATVEEPISNERELDNIVIDVPQGQDLDDTSCGCSNCDLRCLELACLSQSDSTDSMSTDSENDEDEESMSANLMPDADYLVRRRNPPLYHVDEITV